MKRPARVPSQLSEALHRQINAYALAASAAGVAALALTLPAQARIVYTPADVKIGVGGVEVYHLDLNHDGVTDFLLSVFGFDTYLLDVCGPPARPETHPCLSNAKGNRVNEIWGYKTGRSSDGFASALRRGARVAADRKHFLAHNDVMAEANCGSGSCFPAGGPWAYADRNNRYLGLKFVIKGKVHYGWARVNVIAPPPDTRATLTGYAYETISNKPIIAGKTKGPDVVTVQPAALGHLAAGASAIPAWRKESVGLTH
jgi:hypothetical protein